MVLSLAYAFTTRANAEDWIKESLQYVVYDDGSMIVSAAPVYYATINTTWTALSTDHDAITTPYNGSAAYFYIPAQTVDNGLYFPEAYYLSPVYSEEGNVAQYNVYAASHYIGANGTYACIVAKASETPMGDDGELCANHNIIGWTGTINDLPEDIGFNEDSLTSVGEEANTIKTTIDTAVSDYEAGTITVTELQTTIDEQTAQLDNLSPSGIADLIAINNAQNSITIAQETVTQNILTDNLNVSADLVSKLRTLRSNVSSVYTYFKNGYYTQQESMDKLRGYINTAYGYALSYTSDADQNAVQAAIDQIKSYVDIIASYTDINPDVSESAQQGEQQEKEYLESLVTETTVSIEQLSPSQSLTGEQISVTTEILQGVWENPIVKKIIPLCACFLVICVALGIKYKL